MNSSPIWDQLKQDFDNAGNVYVQGGDNENSNPLAGWDGTLNGTRQDTGTFVWAVEGVDYTGKVIRKKGTVLLIR